MSLFGTYGSNGREKKQAVQWITDVRNIIQRNTGTYETQEEQDRLAAIYKNGENSTTAAWVIIKAREKAGASIPYTDPTPSKNPVQMELF